MLHKGAKEGEAWVVMPTVLVMMTQTFKSSDMDMVSSIGPMVPTMKVNGTSTKQKVKELSGTLKAMCTVVSSRMTWPMAMVNTLTSTDPSTKECLRMMFKRVTEKRSGLMEPSMLALT